MRLTARVLRCLAVLFPGALATSPSLRTLAPESAAGMDFDTRLLKEREHVVMRTLSIPGVTESRRTGATAQTKMLACVR